MDVQANNIQQAIIDTPVCPGPQNVLTPSNTAYQGTAAATDPGGEALNYTVSVLPAHGNVTVNYATGNWNYSPNQNFVGTDSFVIMATNTQAQNCTTKITVSVAAQPPSCPLPVIVNIQTGGSTTGVVNATDPQGEALAYSLSSVPESGTTTVNPITGTWNYVPNNTFSGTDSFSIQATNTSGLYCTASVTVNVLNPSVLMEKTVNPSQVAVGASFLYTLQITNNGSANILHSTITDVMPPQLSVNSLSLNGIPITGDLGSGVDIGPLGVGMSAVLVASIKVLSQLNPNTFYNVATGTFECVIDPDKPTVTIVQQAKETMGVNVVTPSLTLIKSAKETFTAVGESISYSLIARNNGNIPLNQVVVRDLLAPEIEFRSSSLSVNGITIPESNIISGVDIGSLDPNQTTTVNFDATVIHKGTGLINNVSNATYDYYTNPNLPPNSGSATSNKVSVRVISPHLKLTKTVNKTLAVLGDILTYQITIENDGDLDAVNVIFKDVVPDSVSLINGTFTVDGVVVNNVNLAEGVNIGNIPMRGSKTIRYQILVETMDSSGIIKNTAIVHFSYIVGDDASIRNSMTEYVTTETSLAMALFKQLSIKNDLDVPEQKPDMEQINDVKGFATVTDSYVVETPKGISVEGQNLTGYKMIIHGLINLIVGYTADMPEQNVHSATYYIPFSTFIVLPPDYLAGCNTRIKADVEDVFFTQKSNRCFFTNTTLLISLNTQ